MKLKLYKDTIHSINAECGSKAIALAWIKLYCQVNDLDAPTLDKIVMVKDKPKRKPKVLLTQKPEETETGQQKDDESEKEERNKLLEFEYICMEIEKGAATRNAVRAFMSSKTFYELMEQFPDLVKRYARACEARAESIFEDIIEIADEANADLIISEKGNLVVNGEAVQRSKLRVDARKWVLSKLDPKKYGDRQQLEHSGEINSNKPDLSKLNVEELRTWGALIRKTSK